MKSNDKNLIISGLALLLCTHNEGFIRVGWIVIAVLFFIAWLGQRLQEKRIERMIEEAKENAIDLSKTMPPEVKEKLHDVFKTIIDNLPKPKKCDDPHCPNCWGLGDEEKKI